MTHVTNGSIAPVEMLPGVHRKTLTDGARMMLIEVRLDAGAVVPMHTHPHEQTGYLARGRMRLTIDGEARDLAAGDAWMIPGDLPHEADALEACLLIDIFSPPREDYR
jgi:quercetin dioxygenase-like cupin family protein